MKKLPYLLFGALVLAGNTFGQTTATTDPVGFNTITALGNSDTRFSVPLHRASSFQGLVQSVSGNVITVQGLPGWTLNQFVYASGTQANTYYVEITSGSKIGMFYTVTANSADSGTANTSSLTVDLNGDATFTSLVSAGVSLKVIPYSTLSTIFPSQTGITTTTSITGSPPATWILLPDISSPGTDLAAASIYYYYSGSNFGGAGWRKLGGGITSIKNDDTIAPDAFVIIRQNGVSSDAVLSATGIVPTTKRAYVIGTLQANTAQDNAIALDIPVALSLSQSNLVQSGAFQGTSVITGSGGDWLLVYDDTVAVTDKAATSIYYYYTGTNFNGVGWRLLGGGISTVRDSDIVLQPGAGYVIRKIAATTASTVVWSVPTPY